MAEVVINRAAPIVQPVDHVVLVLTPEEATALFAVVGSVYGDKSISDLRLSNARIYDVVRALRDALRAEGLA